MRGEKLRQECWELGGGGREKIFVMKPSKSSDACCIKINCLEMLPGSFLRNEGDSAGFRNSSCTSELISGLTTLVY